MTWAAVDKGVGDSNIQSILFQEYLGVLLAGVAGVDCVLAGCAVTPQGSPNMTVAVAKGAVLANGVLRAVTAGNVTVGTADGTNPRLDLIVVDASGAKQCRAGTAAAAPKPPARTANDVVLAVVYVPASDTTIAGTQITDLRVQRLQGPIVIYRQSAVDTVNTTNAAIHILNRGGSGLTIPNGLFLSGRQLRIRAGGSWLGNNGTPTITVAVSYGGTTMFSDVTGAITNDADRRAWSIDLVLTAQANNDQALNGLINLGKIAASTAPTTGVGDAADTAGLVNTVNGAAAVDSDAADRVLAATWTFSVSNANDELTIEFATVELV